MKAAYFLFIMEVFFQSNVSVIKGFCTKKSFWYLRETLKILANSDGV